MPRPSIYLDKAEFQGAINALENKQSFANRSALWKAFELTPYATERHLKAQTAMVKAKELGIVLKTPKGKKGSGEGLREWRANNQAAPRQKKRIPLEVIDKIRKVVPERYHRKVDKLGDGSLKSAVFIKCMDCSAYVSKEVANCTVTSCALWPYRPFNKVSKEGEAVETNETETNEG